LDESSERVALSTDGTSLSLKVWFDEQSLYCLRRQHDGGRRVAGGAADSGVGFPQQHEDTSGTQMVLILKLEVEQTS
jgi:hypothetical protein